MSLSAWNFIYKFIFISSIWNMNGLFLHSYCAAYTSAIHIALAHQYGTFTHAAADPSDHSCCRQSPLYRYTHNTLSRLQNKKASINIGFEKPQFNTGGLGRGKPQAHSVSQEDVGKWFDTGWLLAATLKSQISFGSLTKNIVKLKLMQMKSKIQICSIHSSYLTVNY